MKGISFSYSPIKHPRWVIVGAFLLVMTWCGKTATGQELVQESPKQPTLLVFDRQWDARSAMLQFEREGTPLSERVKMVQRNGLNLSKESLTVLSNWLANNRFENVQILDTFWISNAVTLILDSNQFEALQKESWVGQLLPASALPMGYTEGQEASACQEAFEPENTGLVNGKEPGLSAVQAPQMWARGYTGKGRRALLMDTGVWPQIRPFEENFWGIAWALIRPGCLTTNPYLLTKAATTEPTLLEPFWDWIRRPRIPSEWPWGPIFWPPTPLLPT
jgi:hypothetical protein